MSGEGMRWPDWLEQQATQRQESGLSRVVAPRAATDDTIDLAGNDYLGLSRHPLVTAAAADAALMWGAGSGASRLVTGSLRLHERLEQELADYTGQPAALVMSTGYQANLSVVTALADRDTLVVSDAHIHASLVDAVRLSRADLVVVAHNSVAAVAAALATSGALRAMVLAESVYSVLGDEAPLAALSLLCQEYGALLVIDEAHGLGVHGPGLVHRHGLNGLAHIVVTGTLSKALGSQGGAVLGSLEIVEHLINRARPFIYDTALAPASTAAAIAALQVLRDHPDLPDVVRRRVQDLAAALGVEPPAGAVLSVPMASPRVAVAARDAALAQGVRVGCFRPPSVPDGISRLRITVNAGLSEAAWARATEVLVAVVKEHG